MSDAKQIRPSQVTMAAWMVIVGSAIVVLSVFEQLGSFNTVEAREGVEKFLSEPPAKGLGLSVDTGLTLLRVMAMVAAGCATAAAVLGWHVLRRHRASRVALTVVAVPLFFTGMVAGGLLLLARRGLGVDAVDAARPRLVRRRHPPQAGDRAPVGCQGTREPSRVGRVRSRASSRRRTPASAHPPGSRPPNARRPAQVTWACLLTWGFCAMTIVTLVAGSLAVIADSSGVIDEARRQNPDLADAGMSDRALLIGVVLVIVALLAWSVLAIVVAWFVWKGREWARITLICSAGVAAGLGVIAVLVNVDRASAADRQRSGDAVAPEQAGGRVVPPAEDAGRRPASSGAEVGRGQPAQALLDDCTVLAERPPDQMPPGVRVVVEPLERDGHDAGAVGQLEAEGPPVVVPEMAYVGRGEVGALRHSSRQPDRSETVAQQVAP